MAGESWPGLPGFYVCLVALIPCRLRASGQLLDDLDRVDVAVRLFATEMEDLSVNAVPSLISNFFFFEIDALAGVYLS